MEFYQLEYICTVADRGGYNQADGSMGDVKIKVDFEASS